MDRKTDPSCIFCKIATHELESALVFENEHCIAFRDINPKARTHVIVIPKIHIETLEGAEAERTYAQYLWEAVLETGKALNVLDQAKLFVNSGTKAGQEVPHLHVHILSDK